MAKTRFHSLLEAKIREEVAKYIEIISSGGCPSIESYRAEVGYVRGLQTALKLADETEGDLEA